MCCGGSFIDNSFVHSFLHLFVHSFVRLFVCSFVRLLVCFFDRVTASPVEVVRQRLHWHADRLLRLAVDVLPDHCDLRLTALALRSTSRSADASAAAVECVQHIAQLVREAMAEVRWCACAAPDVARVCAARVGLPRRTCAGGRGRVPAIVGVSAHDPQ
jgi:hypothetical protein